MNPQVLNIIMAIGRPGSAYLQQILAPPSYVNEEEKLPNYQLRYDIQANLLIGNGLNHADGNNVEV